MKSSIILFTCLMSASALAIPVAPHNALDAKFLTRQKSFNPASLAYNFEGIVKLSNCSGALIKFAGQSEDSLGVVMTNGHCIQKPGGYLSAGEVWVNRRMPREMKIFDSAMKLSSIKATKILYATMTNTDVAYYELNETYAQIEERTKVRPLEMDAARPAVGTDIQIISGYWDRGWDCKIDAFIPEMREGQWSWVDSIRYTPTCDTMGGTSGSPIIAKGTRTVVGVNNTSNEKGENCTLNNPCEVDTDGTTISRRGVRYGQQTFNVYTCLRPDFAIDLTIPGCDLPK